MKGAEGELGATSIRFGPAVTFDLAPLEVPSPDPYLRVRSQVIHARSEAKVA